MLSRSPGLTEGSYIVAADEKPEILELIVQTLRKANHCVFQAYDGQAAFELCVGLQTVDLLITNTKMPGMTGPELIKRVRDMWPGLPVLYIKNPGQPAASLAELPPDVPTLAAPFTAEELLAMVKPLLALD